MPSTLRYGIVRPIAFAGEAACATFAPVKRPGDSVGTVGRHVLKLRCYAWDSRYRPDGFFAREEGSAKSVTLRAYHHSNERSCEYRGCIAHHGGFESTPEEGAAEGATGQAGHDKRVRSPPSSAKSKSAAPLERTTVHNTSDAPWLTLTTVLLYISFAGRSR